MKIAPFWVSIALLVPRALAVLTESIAISATFTTSTAAAPSCTSSPIASLCSYPEPGPNFAVAIDSRASCWDYCNAHSPCNFVIFSAGNPNTGTGTCWLYPGETFDESKGSSDCTNPSLSVYSQPVCAGGRATTTAGACAATATPSAIASVCGYPTPGDCFNGCTASTGVSNCLSQCAKADSCSYVVFNPDNPSNSPYASGSCWIYPNGTFNAGSVTACSGSPEQFVYNNLCPKPSPSSSSLSSSTTERSSGTGTAGTTPGSTTSAATSSNGTETAGNTTGSTTSSKNSAPTSLSLTNPLAIGVAILIWQAV
ncbi:uncharacterized protein N7446_003146 [Penicillium canescens]|uniref:Apple domain-containing protein n=1 Tax=Penicillium canescens TaxID=5083 RepID=A0AAD6IFF4_PENCN|nr:uncharacterized protein N7446_003146 [Penicillium canescens]KAJ6044948.1 hypothetical protein N7460_006303 [Penicillium canescens]KAJ6056417.1 hypothetical protein N7444_005515 [Penicillium canescens]KAJ6075369.1 hypothetical protein N7446_003146 [Penicillium canescens]